MDVLIDALTQLKTRSKLGNYRLSSIARSLGVLFIFTLALMRFTPLQAAERQMLRGHVPRAVEQSRAVGALDRTARLGLTFSLPLQNPDQLTLLLKQISDPASSNYHQYLTPEQFADRFSPIQADYEKLISYVEANGMTVTGKHANRTLLEVSAPSPSVEKTLHVRMMRYQHATRGAYYAPDRDPSLDTDVHVLSIGGLSDFSVAQPANLKKAPLRNKPRWAPAVKARMLKAGEAMPATTGTGPGSDFIGKDYRAAYAPGVSLTGAGQAIALVEFDGFFANDVPSNFAAAGLPPVNVQTILVAGYDGSAHDWNTEVILDIMMAAYMAPEAKVLVYETYNSSSVVNALFNRIATDNVAQQISSSWYGFGRDPATDQIFQQFAAQGQSFFECSADHGSYPNAYNQDIPTFVDDPYVTVVGGTSLVTTGPGGPWHAETAWNGSGGGKSTYYAIPDYQQGTFNGANGGSSTMRNTPDIAMLADCQIFLITFNGQAGTWCGTSAATPLWAGFIALANQQAAMNGKPRLGFLNPVLYAIGKGPNYASDFHDIDTGNNNGFNAVTGYDLVTGWGSPNGQHLIDDLTGMSASTFTLSGSPTTVTVGVGGSGSSMITVAPKNGFNGNVSLAASGAPSGVTTSFSSATTTSGSMLSFAVSTSAKAGTYPITVQGTSQNSSGTLTSPTTLALTINAQPSFTLSASPASFNLQAGTGGSSTSATSTITVSPQNGFNGSVNVSAFSVPRGVTFSVNPTSTTSKSALTFEISQSAQAGTYPVEVIGTSGSLTNETRIALTIGAPKNSGDVPVSFVYNLTGILPDGASTSNSLIDGGGWAYSANLLGAGPSVTSRTINGTQFLIGPAARNNDGTYTANAVTLAILYLPEGQYSTLKMLAAGVNGNHTTQTFQVLYTDGTRSSIKQNLSDWYTPQNYPGESTALSMPYRNTNAGTRDSRTFYLYEYSFNLDSGKTVSSIMLPDNRNVVVLAMTLTQ